MNMTNALGMKVNYSKSELIRLTLVPFLMGLLWLAPIIWTFPIPDHYNIGLETRTAKDIEVWDLWFYFPALAGGTILTAFLARKLKITKTLMGLFVVATVLGQILGMAVNLSLASGSAFSSGFLPFGAFIVAALFTVIVMPVVAFLFFGAHSLFKVIQR